MTAGFFETLGVAPRPGRTLAPEEEAPGGPPVVLISRRQFGRKQVTIIDREPEPEAG